MFEDLHVVIAGAAGEGVQTVGEVLAETIAGHGYAVFAWQEFESRIRGARTVIPSLSAGQIAMPTFFASVADAR